MMENIERGMWRGKDVETGEWIIGWISKWENRDGSFGYQIKDDGDWWHDVDPSTLGEYTGIWDTEEKPLFEGDIVTLHQFLFDGSEVESILTALIEYDPGQAAFFLTRIENDFYQDYTGYRRGEGSAPICMFYGLHEESFTRIGNKWDNPDLLGGA